MNDDSIIEITPNILRELLDKARDFGYTEDSQPKWFATTWTATREKWIESRLACQHKLSEYFRCEVLGIHKYHGAEMGSPLQWVGWDDNGMTPGEPDLPAGYDRDVYEKNKAEIDERRRQKKNQPKANA